MPNNYLSDTETSSALQLLITLLKDDPTIHQSLLALVPNTEKLEQMLLALNESRAAAVGDDPQKILQLEAHRKQSKRALSRYEALVKLAAEDDPTLRQKVGINVHKEKKAHSTGPLSAPGNLSIRHSTEHGVVIGNTSSVKRARSFLIEICEGDPSIESKWRYAASSARCTKMEIRGLTPGTVYWFRVRAVGNAGSGPWSTYVTLMAM